MAEKKTAELPFQVDFNKMLTEKLTSAMPGKLDGQFVTAACPAGFNYGITYGLNAFCNELTLSILDSTIQTDTQGVTSFADQRLSTLYMNALDKCGFLCSSETQAQLNKWDAIAESEIANVLRVFEDGGGTYSDPIPFGGKITDVLMQVIKMFNLDVNNPDYTKIPDLYAPLKNAILSYQAKYAPGCQIRAQWARAKDIKDAAYNNVKTPTKANGALQTGTSSYYVGYPEGSTGYGGQTAKQYRVRPIML